MIGKRLAHYEILEKLGEGGMGVVYKARDTHLERYAAIKVLPPEKVTDVSRKARFIQEARAASSLNHPNIITIYDISSDEGHDYIAMEYVAGRTLDEIISRKGLRLNEALKIAVQIADALDRAHGVGIVHRDLKPANIMVDAHGAAKVLDFGLAKLTEKTAVSEDDFTRSIHSRSSDGLIVGTVAYMSPEQAEGRQVDARSDIFSFGALLYEMVTGRKAFQGDSQISTLSAVLERDPKPMGNAPHDLEKLVLRCLKKDPDRRFQHMIDLEVALRELVEETESHPEGIASPSAKGRKSRLAAGIAVLTALGGVGTAAWWYQGHADPPPRLVQLSSYPGTEVYPSFSPDGDQVAFTWGGEKSTNQDIYVKLAGEPQALRLTSDPAQDLYPAWSPDGKRIAFQRNRPTAPGIWTVSPLGGAEQEVVDLPVIGQMAWSPDGKWLAVAKGRYSQEPDGPDAERGIALVRVARGEVRSVTQPKAPAFDISPAFSPDGRAVAYANCTATWSCEVVVQRLDGEYMPRGEPRRITSEGRFIRGMAWSNEGARVIYSASWGWGVPRLRRVESSGDHPSEPLDVAGVGARGPSISRSGRRLAFWKYSTDFDIWAYTLGGTAKPWLGSSSLGDTNAQFSPDGRRIAYASQRGGVQAEIWVANADGSQPVQVAKGLDQGQGSPQWSPDGRLLTFDSLDRDGQSQIYVVEATGGRPWRVSPGGSNDSLPSFSRDGQWVYYASNRSGRGEVWRVPIKGGAARQMTENGGDTAFESADGKLLIYQKSETSPLFMRPVVGGPERVVLDYVFRRSFQPVDDGVYFIGKAGEDGSHPVEFHDSATGSRRIVCQIDGALNIGLSVSPDRKTILFSKSVTSGADLMMIENFR